jgi:hypothetical protein
MSGYWSVVENDNLCEVFHVRVFGKPREGVVVDELRAQKTSKRWFLSPGSGELIAHLGKRRLGDGLVEDSAADGKIDDSFRSATYGGSWRFLRRSTARVRFNQ